MLPLIHVLLLCTLPGKTAEGKRSLAKKLPFLLSGLPHAVQPSFWPKPRALHVPMTLSHLQHSQPCSHLLAPGPCLAGTSLTAPFGEAHSPPGCGGFQGTAGADSTATSVQIFWNNLSLSARTLSWCSCHLPAAGAAAGDVGRAPGWTFLPCASFPELSGDGCHFPPQSCCEQP